MSFDQTKPAASGPLASVDVRNNFQHIKTAVSKEHNWSDTDGNAVTHKLSVLKGKQFFASSGTFTVPANVSTVWVTLCGGGGGGGIYGGVGDTCSYGGGGADSKIAQAVMVTPGEVVAVTVGAGGTTGSYSNSGGNGGTSSFGSYVSCAGGSGCSTSGGGNGSGNGSKGSSVLSNSGASGGSSAFGVGGNGGCSGSGYGAGGGSGAAGTPGFVLVEW